MDPRKLIIVLEVAEQGSVSRAAQTLRIAQPSLSRTISEFEETVGVRIFNRGSRGVTLTPEGERLLTHARAIRAELHHAERDISDARSAEQAPISIGIVPVHPIDPLIGALLDLITARPKIHANLETGTRDQLVKRLTQGEFDMILGPLPPEPLGLGFTEEIIYYEELEIFCGRQNRLFGCAATSLEELAGMNWILGKPGATSRRRVEALFRSQGVEPPRINIEFEDIPARRAMVLQSDFLSVFQRNHVMREIESGRIYALPIPWGQDDRPIGIIRLNGLPLSAPAADFITSVRTVFARSGARTLRPGPKAG